jgi:DNA-directed RNA polymerase II subunit RPB2
MDNSVIWNIINSYFEQNPQSLVRHHVESYNDFFKKGIFKIFRDKNPVQLSSKYDETIGDFRHKCILYFGGKNGDKLYFGKPVIYDKENPHFMFPNEARLRNMTYGMTIHYDIDIEFIDILEEGEAPYLVDTQMVGLKGGEFIEKNIQDYTEDHIVNEANNIPNYKLNENAVLDEDTPLTDLNNAKSTELQGGSNEKKEKERKKRSKHIEVEMTPAIAALLREKSEETMKNPNKQIRELTLPKIYLGKFPIMVQSDFCILQGLPREVRFNMGECKNDIGGYFIINGKEKTVITQEKFADNMLYIRSLNEDDKYLYSAEIRSVSENVSKPIRTFSVKMVRPSPSYSFKNMVVLIPNVREPIPLFIVFRALGILTDKKIIEMCLLDTNKYEFMVDLFEPSIHDCGAIMTQSSALVFIASFTKYHTASYALEILSDYFLPHIGETNFIDKAYYLGYIVFRLLLVVTGLEKTTDRDNFKYKRMELVGSLINDLFREYYNLQQKQIHVEFEKRLYFNKSRYADNLVDLIQENYREILGERVLELGFKKAFKGNWGAQTHTKRVGVVQDLNRLSFNSMISHLRKTNIPLDSSVKLVGPRLLHNSQWGFVDPVDTPDGANIGIHKHLSIMTYISRDQSREPIIKWLKEKVELKLLKECSPSSLSTMTKVMVNGFWAGSVIDPFNTINKMRLFRRNSLIPIYTSITFEIKTNTIFVYCDGGRPCRPIFYRDPDSTQFSVEQPEIIQKIKAGNFTWDDLTTGFNEKRNLLKRESGIYELNELYEGIGSETDPNKVKRFLDNKAIIDYIDSSETENTLILMNRDETTENMTDEQEKSKKKNYTHLEIHESLIFGVMTNQVIFPENNPVTRNSFSCGQSKQACSLYHTNYQVRMDKTALILNSGQVPLVKTRFLEHINHEENPYGENAIVAIMCYTGYNVEDAILLNEAAVKRGLFRTTYFSVYEEHEENSKKGDALMDKHFSNIESETMVIGKKIGYDYSKLDKYGLIKENTEIDDKMILIGLTSNNTVNPEARIDMSKTTKKGQLGIVDKSFITEGEEGERIAKIRIREERLPTQGDKMAGRAGQKGVVGLVIPESDMPFTKDGLKPDMIINPHAFPTRQTIGQLVESIVGKASAIYGGYGDCTAFNNRGSKTGIYGKMLSDEKYHSSGNEILYNGFTGKQIEAEIFIGPCYYMRLKHMVKDKINYRAAGPRTALTRQPVSGRANDGGLRIGEMERDSLISHGAVNFLTESMMERGDKYFIAVCNTTGMISIYNPAKNLFLSPSADGPIKFNDSIDGTPENVHQITKFGRSFSVLSVPYTFKLLIQELQTMGVQMRIITDDNIRQLENLSFSKNIELATGKMGITVKDLINDIRLKLRDPLAQKIQLEPSDKFDSDEMPEFEYGQQLVYQPEPGTYEYEPKSPEFSPKSPEFSPDSTGFRLISSSPNIQESSLVESPDLLQYPSVSPESQDQTGGKKTEIEHVIGDQVYWRNDLNKPSRIWRIRKIGDKFITIETNDTENLDIQDSIQVVSPIEIYLPNEYSYLQDNDRQMAGNIPFPQMVEPPPMFYGGIAPNTGGIHFAPKIIVNGSDNSNVPNTGMFIDDSTDQIERINNQSRNNNEIRIKPQISAVETDQNNDVIDFTKPLLIVKR